MLSTRVVEDVWPDSSDPRTAHAMSQIRRVIVDMVESSGHLAISDALFHLAGSSARVRFVVDQAISELCREGELALRVGGRETSTTGRVTLGLHLVRNEQTG